MSQIPEGQTINKQTRQVNRIGFDRVKNCGSCLQRLYCGLAFIWKTTQDDFRGPLVWSAHSGSNQPYLLPSPTTVCLTLASWSSCYSQIKPFYHCYQECSHMLLFTQDKIDLNVSLQLDSLHIYFKHVHLFRKHIYFLTLGFRDLLIWSNQKVNLCKIALPVFILVKASCCDF